MTSQQDSQHHELQQQHSVPGARVLDGKAIAADWSEQLQQQVPGVRQALGRPPGLAVVLVGSRPDSMLYVSKKEEACMRIGINCRCGHGHSSLGVWPFGSLGVWPFLCSCILQVQQNTACNCSAVYNKHLMQARCPSDSSSQAQ
jgi:hypothetical protein